MNLKEYQQLSARTLARLESKEEDYIHMHAGVFTEFGELIDAYKRTFAYGKPLDEVNLQEELADIMFYLVGGSTIAGDVLEDVDLKKLHSADNILSGETWGEYCPSQAIMVLIFINSLIDEEDVSGPDIIDLLYIFAEWANINIAKALENNVNKLKARYPEKFTNEKALNRDLKTERAALEK